MTPKHCAILLSLSCALASAPLRAASRAPAALRSVHEITLPQFKMQSLADDLPVRDLGIAEDGRVYVLGTRALWTWETQSRQLSRFVLPIAPPDDSSLARLGTDGTSIFVASRATLFQLDPASGRTFRFLLPQAAAGETLGFAGKGDRFHWLNTAVIARFDRYGRRVDAVWTPPLTRQDGPAHFDVEQNTLWFVRGKMLMRVHALDAGAKPQQVFKAKHRILDMTRHFGEIILHTAHTVLRLNEKGRLVQAIPVEGQRRLVAMHISESTHAYAFDDQLLEIYDLATQTAHRYMLPLDRQETIARFVIAGKLVVVASSRDVRAFRLAP